MQQKYSKSLSLALLVILVFALQLGATRLTWAFARQIDFLEFGARTASLAFFTIVLGVVSGIVLALAITGRGKHEPSPQRSVFAAGLLGVIPLLVIVLKLYIGAFGPRGFPFLRPVWNEVYEWTIHSQVPSLWLGLIVGWFVSNRSEG